MHEMALTQDLVGLIAEHCAGRRVTRVVLEVGKLAAVVPDAFRFCFELVRRRHARGGRGARDPRAARARPVPRLRGGSVS